MSKKAAIQILKWVVSIGLITWLYSQISWSEFGSMLTGSSPIYLPLAVVVIAFNTLFCTYKWKLLLKADSLDQPLGQLTVSYMIGSFVSLFLPSNIGGDSYRIYDLGSRTKQGVRSFTSVFADRFSGFLALSIIGLIGGLSGYALLRDKSVILVLLLFLGLILAMLVLIIDPRFVKFCLKITRLDHIGAIAKSHQSFVETFQRYGGNWRLVLSVMLLSAAFHLGYITVIFFYNRFLGLEYPYFIFVVFIPIIALFEALPISIYGIGIRDTAYVYFFAQVGMPSEQALGIALVHLIMNVLFASTGGLLFLFRKSGKNRAAALAQQVNDA